MDLKSIIHIIVCPLGYNKIKPQQFDIINLLCKQVQVATRPIHQACLSSISCGILQGEAVIGTWSTTQQPSGAQQPGLGKRLRSLGCNVFMLQD